MLMSTRYTPNVHSQKYEGTNNYHLWNQTLPLHP
jgi:hypothetical protein